VGYYKVNELELTGSYVPFTDVDMSYADLRDINFQRYKKTV
jgi:hypothetical protein